MTVSCAIEGRPLGTMRCDHPGEYLFAKPVPESWLATDKEIHVTFSAEPRWVSPEDGNQLGFLLRSAGFVDAIDDPGDSHPVRRGLYGGRLPGGRMAGCCAVWRWFSGRGSRPVRISGGSRPA